ncbi:hypothetical protein [Saccharomonospora sp. NB11]|uniref:hypothetical protein n=1 Tax=Saccharomonospora sp. NB11 TaxID=1642298 RepID=UPI0018D0236A|nr:hypothetical protein [Saccharomonospora sp. NB11]
MTRESDGGRPQKTVAELLAEHGGQVGGTPRRRRRRAAEDDGQPGITDTAPQAIIDRIRAEGPPPPGVGRRKARQGAEGEDQTPPGHPRQQRTGPQQAPSRPPQNSGSLPTAGNTEAPARPPLPPRGQATRSTQPPAGPPSSLPPSNTHSTGYGKPTTNGFRLPGKPQQNSGPNPVPPPAGAAPSGAGTGTSPTPPPPAAPGGQPPQSPQSPSSGPQAGQQDAASRMTATRRVPAAPPPPSAQQEGTLAARLDGLTEADESEQPASPPPAQGAPQRSNRFPMPPRRRRPPRGAPAPEPEPHTEQLPAVSANAAESDSEKTALAEPIRPDEPPAGLSGWPGRRGAVDVDDSSVEETQIHPPTPLDDDEEGPDTGYYVPDFDDDDDDEVDATRIGGALDDDPLGESAYDARYGVYGADPYADDLYDDDPYDDADGARDSDDRATDRDGGEDAEADDDRRREAREDDAEPAEEGSPAKQWLVLAGQLALGVAGGAGVWLGFNWLWGKLPAAALIAALVVTVGLVWIVRKVRRAEDTQTTVLALLVGLVVTVSPAALLLVSR